MLIEAEKSVPVSTLVSANRTVRLVYCLALLAIFPSMLMGARSWIGLMTGGGLLRMTGTAGFFGLLVMALFRVVRVARVSSALDARITGVVVGGIRGVAVGAMTIGAACAVGLFLVKPITLLLFRSPGEGGIAFFVVGVYLFLGSNLGWLGVLLFELGRLLGGTIAKASVPLRHNARVVGYAAAGVAACGLAAACIGMWSEHQKFVRLCPYVAKPKVLARAGEPFENILIKNVPATGVAHARRIQELDIALLDPLSYVEHCIGSYCTKVTNSRTGNPYSNDRRQIKETFSKIVFEYSSLIRKSRTMGATLYEIQYRIGDSSTRKTLASASELVFDWGSFAFFRGLISRGSAAVEACGYALPQPHKFGSNIYKDTVYEAYDKADKALILSVLPGPVSTPAAK